MIVLAAFLLLCGSCSAAFYLFLPLLEQNRPTVIQSNVIFGSVAGFGFLFGAVLIWQGLVTVRGGESIQAARVFPPVAAMLLAFLGALFIGLGALAFQPLAAYLFPPWHFVAGMMMPLVFLAYAARQLGKDSGLRALITPFGWGALGATAIAALLEISIAIVLALIAVSAVSFMPGGNAMLDQLRASLGPERLDDDLTQFSRLLTNPVVTGSVLFYFALIVPPVEEALKTIVVAFADPRRARWADILLWGMGAGAGFAVMENLLNASVTLGAWATVMVLRIGATTMHIANGATMARGWYVARAEGRWSGLILAYAASVLFHAAWNAIAILLSGSALFIQSQPVAVTSLLAGSVLVLALIAILSILFLLGWSIIIYAVHTARKNVSINA